MVERVEKGESVRVLANFQHYKLELHGGNTLYLFNPSSSDDPPRRFPLRSVNARIKHALIYELDVETRPKEQKDLSKYRRREVREFIEQAQAGKWDGWLSLPNIESRIRMHMYKMRRKHSRHILRSAFEFFTRTDLEKIAADEFAVIDYRGKLNELMLNDLLTKSLYDDDESQLYHALRTAMKRDPLRVYLDANGGKGNSSICDSLLDQMFIESTYLKRLPASHFQNEDLLNKEIIIDYWRDIEELDEAQAAEPSVEQTDETDLRLLNLLRMQGFVKSKDFKTTLKELQEMPQHKYDRLANSNLFIPLLKRAKDVLMTEDLRNIEERVCEMQKERVLKKLEQNGGLENVFYTASRVETHSKNTLFKLDCELYVDPAEQMNLHLIIKIFDGRKPETTAEKFREFENEQSTNRYFTYLGKLQNLLFEPVNLNRKRNISGIFMMYLTQKNLAEVAPGMPETDRQLLAHDIMAKAAELHAHAPLGIVEDTTTPQKRLDQYVERTVGENGYFLSNMLKLFQRNKVSLKNPVRTTQALRGLEPFLRTLAFEQAHYTSHLDDNQNNWLLDYSQVEKRFVPYVKIDYGTQKIEPWQTDVSTFFVVGKQFHKFRKECYATFIEKYNLAAEDFNKRYVNVEKGPEWNLRWLHAAVTAAGLTGSLIDPVQTLSNTGNYQDMHKQFLERYEKNPEIKMQSAPQRRISGFSRNRWKSPGSRSPRTMNTSSTLRTSRRCTEAR